MGMQVLLVQRQLTLPLRLELHVREKPLCNMNVLMSASQTVSRSRVCSLHSIQDRHAQSCIHLTFCVGQEPVFGYTACNAQCL